MSKAARTITRKRGRMISNAEYDQSIIRNIAQSDPVPNLTANLGTTFVRVRKSLDALIQGLRELDDIQDHLARHGLKQTLDLGPIGNAAAAARRDLERTRDGNTFELPR